MYAIRGTRLFDGENASLIERPLVLVDAGRVVAVQPGGVPPQDVPVTDLGDVTLLPGLIDSHIHLCFNASTDPVGHLSTSDDEVVLEEMRAAARSVLAAGVTTVRDLGDRGYLALRLRAETAREAAAGPHILAAGPPITMTRGHCWYLGGEADGIDGVRAAVHEHADRGVDVIKVMATGGELTPGTRSHVASYGLNELQVIVAEAHAVGLPTTAHAHGIRGIANAAEAGFDMIEHCSFITEDGAEIDLDVVEILKRNGTIIGATLGSLPGRPVPPRIQELIPKLVAASAALRDTGLTIVCSSDAGISPAKPHDMLPWAADMLVNLNGYSTLQALRGMTSIAAMACRVGDRKGRLAAGFDADLLAVRGNPLADIAALREVAAVYRLGTRIR